MRRNINQAISQLRAQVDTAGLGDELAARYQRVRPGATAASILTAIGLLVIATVAAFFIAMRHDLDYVQIVLGTWPIILLREWQTSLVVLAIVIVAAVQLRAQVIRYRLCRLLDAHNADTPAVAVARQLISTARIETLFRLVSIILPVILVVTGLAWAGLIWVGTTSALDCAKSSKCL